MAAGGYLPEDFDDGPAEVWPENWPAVQVFLRVNTQWEVGFAGRTRLIYEAVYPILDRLRLTDTEWLEMLEDISVLEAAALETMHAKS